VTPVPNAAGAAAQRDPLVQGVLQQASGMTILGWFFGLAWTASANGAELGPTGWAVLIVGGPIVASIGFGLGVAGIVALFTKGFTGRADGSHLGYTWGSAISLCLAFAAACHAVPAVALLRI
jgi:hypothetical protein